MKIITVLHSMKSGGAERHALQLMRGLRARGHEALYAGPMDGWLGQQLSAGGFGGVGLPPLWTGEGSCAVRCVALCCLRPARRCRPARNVARRCFVCSECRPDTRLPACLVAVPDNPWDCVTC